MSKNGVFIVLEGTDGSGKGTQFNLLTEHLKEQGHDIATFDFPQYEQPSSYFVKKYLNGDYGTVDEVGPYTSSLFYALDRYEAAPAIREALAQGKVVLANRFTGSSMGHQGTKFTYAEERRGFFIWLDNLEFEMLKIPRPDINLVLRVPAETAQKLVDQKERRSYTDKKRDIHEADLNHLERAVAVYDDLCQLFPKDFQRIDCVRSGQLMPIEAIQEIIRQKVTPLLPAPSTNRTVRATNTGQSNADAAKAHEALSATIRYDQKDEQGNYPYHVPTQLDPATQAAYRSHLNEIFDLYTGMVAALTTHIGDKSGAPKKDQDAAWKANIDDQARAVLRAVLPVAIAPLKTAVSLDQDIVLQKLARELLSDNHTNDSRTDITLVDVWPRNELDLIPDLLYTHSNLPLTKLREIANNWPYDKKLGVYEAASGQALPVAFKKMRYSWDIVADYDSYCNLAASESVTLLKRQELTPRYGFDMPPLVDQAGLTEQFEQCFEISLKLHSLLLANNYPQEAQYATLLGHKVRFTLTLTAIQMFELFGRAAGTQNSSYRMLLLRLFEKLSQVHPILGEQSAPL